MNKKVSFNEIIAECLNGIWCDGLALLTIDENMFHISNIFNNNEKNLPIDSYPISRTQKIFSRVIEMAYDEAVREFRTNKKNIISPRAITEIQTFERIKRIEFGANVYCHTKEGKVIVNDISRFESIDEIEEMGFISDEEKNGKWLVF